MVFLLLEKKKIFCFYGKDAIGVEYEGGIEGVLR